MTKRRRVTDRLPLSNIVSVGNLDDRMATVDARITSAAELREERWRGHERQHEDLAQALREYKSEANEWRRTVSDLRADFLLKAEFQSEFKRLESLIQQLDNRQDGSERAIQSITDREVTTRSVLSSGRAAIVLGFTVVGGVITILLFINPRV